MQCDHEYETKKGRFLGKMSGGSLVCTERPLVAMWNPIVTSIAVSRKSNKKGSLFHQRVTIVILGRGVSPSEDFHNFIIFHFLSISRSLQFLPTPTNHLHKKKCTIHHRVGLLNLSSTQGCNDENAVHFVICEINLN